MKPQSAMIFAAGFGTRLGAIVKDIPKPLVQVAGKALIDHALEIVDTTNISRCAVNLHYHAEKLANHLSTRPELILLQEVPDILDTGGGLLNATKKIGHGPVFTLNSDTVWNGVNPLSALADHWPKKGIDALLLLVPPQTAVGHNGTSDFTLSPNGLVQRAQGTQGYVYTGAQIINTYCLMAIDKQIFSINEIWDQLIKEDRLAGVVYSGKIGDAGTPYGIKATELMLNQ